MRVIAWIVLFTLGLRPEAWATLSVDQQSQLLDARANQLVALCQGDAKTFDVNRVIIDASGAELRCGDEYERLYDAAQDLQKRIANATPGVETGSPGCADEPFGAPLVGGIGGGVGAALDQSCRKDQETQLFSKQCLKEVGCQAARGMVGLFKSARPDDACWDGQGKSGCLEELTRGLVMNLVSSAETPWQLLKMAYKASRGLAILTWHELEGPEDKSSDAALAAASQSPSAMRLFMKDPYLFIKIIAENFVRELISGINEGIEGSFGCAKLDPGGSFLAPKCAAGAQMQAWDCSTCEQKLDAVCGLAGYILGTIPGAFVMGGELSVTRLVATEFAKGGRSLALRIAEAIPAVDTGFRAGGVAIGAAGQVVQMSLNAGARLMNSAAVQKIYSAVLYMKKLALAVPGVRQVVRVTGTPVAAYFKAINAAYATGSDNGSQFFKILKDKLVSPETFIAPAPEAEWRRLSKVEAYREIFKAHVGDGPWVAASIRMMRNNGYLPSSIARTFETYRVPLATIPGSVMPAFLSVIEQMKAQGLTDPAILSSLHAGTNALDTGARGSAANSDK